MCNLYRMSKSADEVAHFFAAIAQDMAVAPGGNAPELVYPGYPGTVVAEGSVQQMVWGFPLQRKGAKGQPLKPKPINNARADKLGSSFWKPSFEARRCIIPVSAFAEAEGLAGGKTRTWFTPPEADGLFAIAGFWRDSAEFGRAYTMIMTQACETVACVHDRMPVILPEDNWQTYLTAEPRDAYALCRPYAGEMRVDRTDEPWAGRR